MRSNIVKKLSAVLVMCILFLLFTGCGSLEEGRAILDDQLEQVMACIEANDKEGIGALAYNQEFRLDLMGFFDDLAAYWPAKAEDSYLCQFITGTTSRISYRGTYLVETGGQEYTIDIAYAEDEHGAGITALYAALSSELAAATTPTGTLQTAMENSPLQWCFLVFWLVCIGFAIFTIVDIIRKKPRYYGLWIVAAVFFLSVSLQLSESSLSNHWMLGILNQSQWLQYPNGANTFTIGLPVCAIAYWGMRNKLLCQKEEAQSTQPNAPVPQVFAVPMEPTPSEPQQEHTEETTE